MDHYAPIIAAIERLGFAVKLSENFSKDTHGYAASAEERAADLNSLVADDQVQMILFSGGETAVELLPLIDYENIRRNPKLFSSYSDGTSILNAIHAQAGLITHYGVGAGAFFDLRHYDYMQFCSHFVEGYSVERFIRDSEWRTLSCGTCEGALIGGYTSLFGLMLSNEYFKYDKDKKYLLFLEDNERFSNVGAVVTYLSFIGQSAFMRNVSGLIFGHFSAHVPEDLLRYFERFGDKYKIPIVYTDDFGHGSRHAIFPIGMNAMLDADKQTLTFL
jgi:muramoyltetrapeptide carboxypeptidase